jgi:Ca-activated chloride channel family protein
VTSPLHLSCHLESSIISPSDQAQQVKLLLDVKGGEGAKRLPMNLALVIDSSESMHIRLVPGDQFNQLATSYSTQEILNDGIPAWQIENIDPEIIKQFPRGIDYVKDSMIHVYEYLRSSDRFSLVAFAGQALTLIKHTNGLHRKRLLEAANQLENLHLGDDTHMEEGMRLGFAEVHQEGLFGYAGRMILLTDGYTRNASDCYAWARRAKEVGIPISTIGMGSEFNENLLIPLADMTGGNAYFIETPEELPDAFRKELGVAAGISYRNVEVQLRLPVNVEIKRAFRVLPELGEISISKNSSRDRLLSIGNYDPHAMPSVLLECEIPAWRSGTYRMAQVYLSWENPESKSEATRQLWQDIVIQISESTTASHNERVMNIAEKVGAFKIGSHALVQAQKGDKQAATQELRDAATRLISMGEQSLAQEMLFQADMLEKVGEADPNMTKKIRYETRRLTKNISN